MGIEDKIKATIFEIWYLKVVAANVVDTGHLFAVDEYGEYKNVDVRYSYAAFRAGADTWCPVATALPPRCEYVHVTVVDKDKRRIPYVTTAAYWTHGVGHNDPGCVPHWADEEDTKLNVIGWKYQPVAMAVATT